MEKFQKLEMLMKSESLSASEVFKYFIQTKQLSVNWLLKMYTSFPICKDTLKDIRPGMFLYKDGQVSEGLIPNKEVKYIVLFVNQSEGKIYCDTLYNTENTWGAIQMYFHHHPEYTMLTHYQFREVLRYWDCINHSRKELSVKQLPTGDYWTPKQTLLAGYSERNIRVQGCDNQGYSKQLHSGEKHIFWRVKEFKLLY